MKAKRTAQEQLDFLDSKLGKGKGAKKEREKLKELIEMANQRYEAIKRGELSPFEIYGVEYEVEAYFNPYDPEAHDEYDYEEAMKKEEGR